jgi:two-component system OmpR family sensor kinase
MIRFRTLRWRIASFYALLLIVVIALAAFVLTFEVRRIVLDAAQAKVDSIGADIARIAKRDSALSLFGDNFSLINELTTPGNLEHWASPSTYIEIDTPQGYPIGKSTNMGSAMLGPSPAQRRTNVVQSNVVYSIENTPLGEVFVREELIRYPGVALIVKVGESLNLYYQILERIRELLALVVLLAAVIVVLGSYALSSSALEPIDRLIAAMGQIRSDQLDRRIGWTERLDELGQLARTFDAMLDRIEEGFARERQFISDASHELKTPLTVINANAQMLERWADKDEEIRAESLRAIREESAALSRMINGMLLLAKAESGDGMPREPVPLDRVVAEAVKLGKARADEKRLALGVSSTAPAGQPVVYGDANLLRQLVSNLVENAIKFTEKGAVDVRLTAQDGHAIVEVVDTGVGIENDALERVFDRFYRTDKSRDRAIPGTGLGLAIVRSIARVHNGMVEVAANPGGGVIFRVTLPLVAPASPASHDPVAETR